MNNDCRAFKPNHVSNPFEYDQLQLIGIQTVKKLAITDETKLEHNCNPGLDESERQAEAEPFKYRCYRIFIVGRVTTILMPL